ncbi:hypothetical protein CC80DRAFT_487976 [Byssothecium circinans]|uniref:Uncharacterized protein n=1 Tax=Byssothecium circinans TaxID=147558 RepID=A0A6A5UCD2_9PLEO|nr:hypothetical protein CC80DRAFT_487976 [Byssothecium circinans]
MQCFFSLQKNDRSSKIHTYKSKVGNSTERYIHTIRNNKKATTRTKSKLSILSILFPFTKVAQLHTIPQPVPADSLIEPSSEYEYPTKGFGNAVNLVPDQELSTPPPPQLVIILSLAVTAVSSSSTSSSALSISSLGVRRITSRRLRVVPVILAFAVRVPVILAFAVPVRVPIASGRVLSRSSSRCIRVPVASGCVLSCVLGVTVCVVTVLAIPLAGRCVPVPRSAIRVVGVLVVGGLAVTLPVGLTLTITIVIVVVIVVVSIGSGGSSSRGVGGKQSYSKNVSQTSKCYV